MERELSFNNLPFEPVEGQVIYIDPSDNKKLNKFISSNYKWVKSEFCKQGLEFCYLPLLAKETIVYNVPYLSEKEQKRKVECLPSLVNYLVKGSINEPCLVFALEKPITDSNGNVILQSIPIELKWYVPTKSMFANLAKLIKQVSSLKNKKYYDLESRHTRLNQTQTQEESISYRISVPRGDDVSYSLGRKTEQRFSINISENQLSQSGRKFLGNADNNFDFQSQILVDEIKQRINALRNRGINTMFLHDLIDEDEHLSRLRITKDFRIFLIDYNNIEIKMPVLPKSVFILFLRHPEGIRFKELSDYFFELLQIYLKMNPIGGRNKHEQSIRDITDPTNNSINEKCARIREAFVAKFDDHLAKNYYVTGKRGEAKRVMLDESMILWEN